MPSSAPQKALSGAQVETANVVGNFHHENTMSRISSIEKFD